MAAAPVATMVNKLKRVMPLFFTECSSSSYSYSYSCSISGYYLARVFIYRHALSVVSFSPFSKTVMVAPTIGFEVRNEHANPDTGAVA
jgi:hypothetical protein